jgi:hypothetical protein
MVDVRDLAAAHCVGAFLPSATGRHILAPHSIYLKDILAAVNSAYPKVSGE